MNRVYLKIDGSVRIDGAGSSGTIERRDPLVRRQKAEGLGNVAKGKRDEGASGLPIKFSAPCPVNTIRDFDGIEIPRMARPSVR